MTRQSRICFSIVMFITGACSICTIWYWWPESREVIRAVNPFVWISLTALGCLIASIPVAQYILVPILKRIPFFRNAVMTPESSMQPESTYSHDHQVRIRIAEDLSQNAVDKIDSVLTKSRP